MDLEKYFDTVNQTKMIELLSRTIKDGQSHIPHTQISNGRSSEQREVRRNRTRLAQGGNISPLCSNIMLNELDQELERRGIRFVRYADDHAPICKDRSESAQRILENILPFIEGKLLLKVNREKTVVAYIGKIKFLGYGFYQSKGEIKLRVHPKSISKMKAKVKELTARSNGLGYEELKLKLKQYHNGMGKLLQTRGHEETA